MGIWRWSLRVVPPRKVISVERRGLGNKLTKKRTRMRLESDELPAIFLTELEISLADLAQL